MKKTFSFGVLHMAVAFTVAYLMTGSLLVGGAIALVEPMINTIAYFFHEKFWESKSRRQNADALAMHLQPTTGH
ncbi:DUF2061 domain-containing protein [Mariprofundus sp. KV]|uniref:DUF2061 domain-containing protein n=1 Tax=Mariprofundus sp. KV TaxID=2608715 RepID=UPI0015A1B43E|nr:DUF2061 domain-containing protein [Mariprofundus sp. KV]NWF36908.1 DUF2061 domain-containing protein [Mariprofundus sp. KV]